MATLPSDDENWLLGFPTADYPSNLNLHKYSEFSRNGKRYSQIFAAGKTPYPRIVEKNRITRALEAGNLSKARKGAPQPLHQTPGTIISSNHGSDRHP